MENKENNITHSLMAFDEENILLPFNIRIIKPNDGACDLIERLKKYFQHRLRFSANLRQYDQNLSKCHPVTGTYILY